MGEVESGVVMDAPSNRGGAPRRRRRTPWVVGAGAVVFVAAAGLVNHAT